MKNTKVTEAQVRVMEAAIRGWVAAGIHPWLLGIALNNAFAHEDVLAEGDFVFDDNSLGEMFDGINRFRSASSKME